MTESLKWPDEFLRPTPHVTFCQEFVTFLELQVSSGTTVTADENWLSFAFLRGVRSVRFIPRGRVSDQRLECWEVLLACQSTKVSHGTVFGLRKYACVVTTGLDNIRAIVELWLAGSDVQAVIDAVPLWDKSNCKQKLNLP